MCYIKSANGVVAPAAVAQFNNIDNNKQFLQGEFLAKDLEQLEKELLAASALPQADNFATFDPDWFTESADDAFLSAPLLNNTTMETSPLDLGLVDLAQSQDLLPWLDSLTAASMPMALASPPNTVSVDNSPTTISAPTPFIVPMDSIIVKPDPMFANSLPESSFSPESAQLLTPMTGHFSTPLFVEHQQPTPSPTSSSTTASTKKSTKRKAPATPAVPVPSADDEDEELLIKRAKNTEAARRSRARKTARLESLESEVTRLEQDKANLLVRLAVLESERSSSAMREADLAKRVAQLEAQLAESHRAMVMGLGVSTKY